MILSTFRKQTSSPAETVAPVAGIAAGSLLCKGFITTLTNPKVLLFFISFFPQFVTPHGTHQTASFLILGMTYALVAFMVDISCALLAGGASDKFAGNQRLQRVMDRIVGIAFIGLGIRLALTRR